MATVTSTLLDEIVERLRAEFSPEQIILFGSRAWGQSADDSDIDLLIVVSESTEAPHRRAVRAHRRLRGILAPMDLIVATREEYERLSAATGSLFAKIRDRGRVLHGREHAN